MNKVDGAIPGLSNQSGLSLQQAHLHGKFV